MAVGECRAVGVRISADAGEDAARAAIIQVERRQRVMLGAWMLLPFLQGEAISARLDLKADRKAKTLLVLSAHAQAGHRLEDIAGPLQGELERMAGWLGLDGVRAGLLRELSDAATYAEPRLLAAAIKRLPLTLVRTRPLDEAISTAGGVPFAALNEALMLQQLPGVFCAGEMLDWEAPTGGYLLTACFASGIAAARDALAWRAIVRGIATHDNAQIVFVDTPGIFRIAKRRLERAMVAAAWRGADDADLVALVVDAERGVGQETRAIVERLNKADARTQAKNSTARVDLAAKMEVERTFIEKSKPSADEWLGALINYRAKFSEKLADVSKPILNGKGIIELAKPIEKTS